MQTENKKSRDLVKEILEHGNTGHIPKGELCVNDDIICSTIGCKKAGFYERFAFLNKLGTDLVSLSPEYLCDLKELPRPEQCNWPDLSMWVRETSLFTFAILDGAFEWGLRLLGLKKFCSMLHSAPVSIKELIKSVEKLNLHMAERLTYAGIDGFILADDIAYQTGLFASPQILSNYFIPSLTRQVNKIRCGGLPVFFHSDGNYRQILNEIVSIGFTGLQCLEKNAGMDPFDIWARYGDKLCLWGHLSAEDISAAADPMQLRLLIDSVRTLAEKGRFILGTASGLFSGIDIHLLQTIYQSVKIVKSKQIRRRDDYAKICYQHINLQSNTSTS